MLEAWDRHGFDVSESDTASNIKQSRSHRRRLLPRLIHPRVIFKSSAPITFRLSGQMRDGEYLSFSIERVEFLATQQQRLQAFEVICSETEKNRPALSDS
ncbi:MAG: hypothetical protein EBR09_16210 [Proteobacteria bacterium]|nr:hypothetical protein [Pseudomonadota bacterium]